MCKWNFHGSEEGFDLVDHECLLSVLEGYGVRALLPFASYLNGRRQVVRIGNSISKEEAILRGVVQGSRLDLLLFLIFVNAIGALETTGNIYLFADDAVLIIALESTNVQTFENTMTASFLLILEFFKHRKLSLNAAKTNFILFQSERGKITMNKNIRVDDHTEISQATSTKYLGLFINDRLDWSDHIDSIRSKIGSAAGVLWKLRLVLPISARKMIFNALVLSHIRYMNFIWGFSPWCKLKDLQVIHNRSLRSVFNTPNRANRCKMFVNQVEQHLPIRGMCVVNTALMVYKALSAKVHTNAPVPAIPSKVINRPIMWVQEFTTRYLKL
jgi:hypothetical protein